METEKRNKPFMCFHLEKPSSSMPVTQILLFMRRLVHVKISINWLKSSKRIAANEAPSFEHSVLIIAPKEGTIPSVFKSKEADDELENRGWLKSSSGPYKWLANFHLDMMAGAVMGGVASNPREQFGVRGWSEKEIGNGSSVLRYFPSVALDFSLKDLYRNILKTKNSSNEKLTGAGCTTLILIYPLDIAHTRLAADIGRTDVR
ncbi:hypothetical protein V6N13_144915 [Hibiscus sabdariffa]